MTSSLTQFVTDWNNNNLSGFNPKLSDPEQVLFRYVQPKHQLRPSSLGQMAFITAMESIIRSRLGTPALPKGVEPYGRLQDLLTVGHITESRIVSIMQHNGYTVSTQVPCQVDIAGFNVTGTADIVMGDCVVDVKTASASNVKRLVSGGGGQKYITQLATYAKALGLRDAALLVYNKDNSELTLIDIPRTELSDSFRRAETILTSCTYLDLCSTLEEKVTEVYALCEQPKPIQQMYKKAPTGRYLVPQELLYNKWLTDILYDTDVGVNDRGESTKYVTNVLSIPEVTERLAVYIDVLDT